MKEPHENMRLAHSAKRVEVLKKDFFRLLGTQHGPKMWHELIRACKEARYTAAYRGLTSIKNTLTQLESIQWDFEHLRRKITTADPLTETFLDPAICDQIREIQNKLNKARIQVRELPAHKPKLAYRDVLAAKVAQLVEFAGVKVTLGRELTSKRRGGVYHTILAIAIELAEGTVPSNLQRHMRCGRDFLKRNPSPIRNKKWSPKAPPKLIRNGS